MDKINKLPTRLENVPLISAKFIFKFSEKTNLESLIKAYFFNKDQNFFDKIENLNTNFIPKQIRDNDANLRYAPTIKIKHEHCSLEIGDEILIINCHMPYVGWSIFKESILEIYKILKSIKVEERIIESYIHYVDFISDSSFTKVTDAIALSISLNNQECLSDDILLRFKFDEDDSNISSVVQIVTNANFVDKLNSTSYKGLVIDIHTKKEIESDQKHQLNHFEKLIENMHEKNKMRFFMCLTENMLSNLGARYD